MNIEEHIKTASDYLVNAEHTNNNLEAELTFYHLTTVHTQVHAALQISLKLWREDYSINHPSGDS